MSNGFVTVAQCVESLPVGRFVWEILICGFLAWFLLGAIDECTLFALSFIPTDWPLNEQRAILMSGAFTLGNFLAILAGGWLADTYGRTMVIRPALFLTAACVFLMAFTRTFIQAFAARFTLGIVTAALLGVFPALLAELLPSRNRGFYFTIWCSGWPGGALFAVIVYSALPGITWHAFCMTMLLPAILLYICARAEVLPESPRYLYLQGLRDEGYTILVDMYEKEDLPMPWAAEAVAVSTASTSASSTGSLLTSRSTFSHAAVILRLGLVVFCVSFAAQSMVLCMPALCAVQQSDSTAATSRIPHIRSSDIPLEGHTFLRQGGLRQERLFWAESLLHMPVALPAPNYNLALVFMQAYIIELVGVVVCAFASTWIYRKQMVQWMLIGAACFTFALLGVAGAGRMLFSGPLIGAQLAAKDAVLNFLQCFCCEHFPTSRRAQTIASVNFAARLGSFIALSASGLFAHYASVEFTVVLSGAFYCLGWALSLQMPLPSSHEQPLHDADEPWMQKGGFFRNRKRESGAYQTI